MAYRIVTLTAAAPMGSLAEQAKSWIETNVSNGEIKVTYSPRASKYAPLQVKVTLPPCPFVPPPVNHDPEAGGGMQAVRPRPIRGEEGDVNADIVVTGGDFVSDRGGAIEGVVLNMQLLPEDRDGTRALQMIGIILGMLGIGIILGYETAFDMVHGGTSGSGSSTGTARGGSAGGAVVEGP